MAELYFSNGQLMIEGKPGKLLSTKEYAEAIGVPESTIRVWISRGKLSNRVKIGRDNYFYMTEDDDGKTV